MTRWTAAARRGALTGLALFFAYPLAADDALRERVQEAMRDENYVLVEDPAGVRLYVLSPGTSVYSPQLLRSAPGGTAEALANVNSANAGRRVRALTQIAGEDGAEALHAALVLLSDPDEAVREEAVQLILEHPDADREGVVAIARRDPSARVREAVRDFLDEGDTAGEE